jgi:hypothetical protein
MLGPQAAARTMAVNNPVRFDTRILRACSSVIAAVFYDMQNGDASGCRRVDAGSNRLWEALL